MSKGEPPAYEDDYYDYEYDEDRHDYSDYEVTDVQRLEDQKGGSLWQFSTKNTMSSGTQVADLKEGDIVMIVKATLINGYPGAYGGPLRDELGIEWIRGERVRRIRLRRDDWRRFFTRVK